MTTTWILVWLTMGQQPLVLTGIASETECRQMVEDVMKQVPKKRKGPVRHGWCFQDMPIDNTPLPEDSSMEVQ